MKISNYELIQKINILEGFKDKKLPQQISYAISKNFRILKKQYDLYGGQLEKIFKEYEEYFIKDKNGNPILNKNGFPKVKKQQEPAIFNEINELLNIKIDIQLYYIEEDLFNYNEQNGRYESLSFNQIILLQSVLCKQ